MGNLSDTLGGAFIVSADFESSVQDDVHPEVKQLEPEDIFEATFNPAVIPILRDGAPKYKDLAGRFDPFEYERMKRSVGDWSALINRNVFNFEDSCLHATALVTLWAVEDAELEVIHKATMEKKAAEELKKSVDKDTNIFVSGTKEYAIEEARIAWRAAVAERNKVLAELNTHVDAKRKHYRQLRDS